MRSRRLLTPTLCVYGFAISYPYTDILSYICIQVQAAVTFRDSCWNSRQGIESQRSIQHASILTYTHTKIALWPFALNTLLPTERISLLRRQCHRCHCFSPFLTGPCTIVFILFILFNYTEYRHWKTPIQKNILYLKDNHDILFVSVIIHYITLYHDSIHLYSRVGIYEHIQNVNIFVRHFWRVSILKIKMNKCWYGKISLEIYLLNYK